MPRTVYSPEFKAKIVIEVLEGARELEAIAADNQLNPNMVRKWKSEFLQNAGKAFEQPDRGNQRSSEKGTETGKRERAAAPDCWPADAGTGLSPGLLSPRR